MKWTLIQSPRVTPFAGNFYSATLPHGYRGLPLPFLCGALPLLYVRMTSLFQGAVQSIIEISQAREPVRECQPAYPKVQLGLSRCARYAMQQNNRLMWPAMSLVHVLDKGNTGKCYGNGKRVLAPKRECVTKLSKSCRRGQRPLCVCVRLLQQCF